MKKTIVRCGVLALFFLTHEASYGITDSCRLTVPAEKNGLMGPIGGYGKPPGAAVIFSDPIVVPAFQLQFVDEKSGHAIVPSAVSISYEWKWLEYPYPEHPWGVWSDASDWVECFNLRAEISVPEFTVRPRGWYDGKYTKFPFTIPFSKKPAFIGISIAINRDNKNFSRAEISPKEIKKLENKTIIVKVKLYGKCDIDIK